MADLWAEFKPAQVGTLAPPQGDPWAEFRPADERAQPEPAGAPSLMDYARTNPVVGAPLQTALRAGQGVEQLLAHGAAGASDLGGLAPNSLSRVLRAFAEHVDTQIEGQNKGYEEAGARVDKASTNPRASKALRTTGEVAGNLLNPAGLAGNLVKAAPGIVNAAARGAASGAGFGASQPVLDTDKGYAGEKAKQIVAGAGAGAVTGGAVAALGGEKFRPSNVPSTKDLKDAAGRAYKAAEDEGVVIRQDSFKGAVGGISKAVEKEGLDADLTPKTAAVLKRFQSETELGDLTLEKAETLRRVASSALDSQEKSDRRLAHIVIDKLDDYVAALTPDDIAASGPGVVRGGGPSVPSGGETKRSLFAEIKSLGGIKTLDGAGYLTREGGEIRAALKDVRSPGLINNKSGENPDWIRARLQERGWFERRDDRGADLDDFYQALRRGTEFKHPESGAAKMSGDSARYTDDLRFRANELGVKYQRDWDDIDIQAAIDERLGAMGDIPKNSGGNPKVAIEALSKARELYARAAKSATLERLMERAKNAAGANYTTAGLETATRQQFRALANNERAIRRFTKEEQSAILKVVRGGPVQNVLRMIGRFSPRGVLTGGAYGYVASQSPALAGGIAVGTTAARMTADQMSLGNVRRAGELVRGGPNALALPGPTPNSPVWYPLPGLPVNAFAQPRGK